MRSVAVNRNRVGHVAEGTTAADLAEPGAAPHMRQPNPADPEPNRGGRENRKPKTGNGKRALASFRFQFPVSGFPFLCRAAQDFPGKGLTCESACLNERTSCTPKAFRTIAPGCRVFSAATRGGVRSTTSGPVRYRLRRCPSRSRMCWCTSYSPPRNGTLSCSTASCEQPCTTT